MSCLMLTEGFKDRNNQQETRISWFCTQLFLFCYYATAPNTIKHKSFEIRAFNTQRSVSEKHFHCFPKHKKTTNPKETFRAQRVVLFQSPIPLSRSSVSRRKSPKTSKRFEPDVSSYSMVSPLPPSPTHHERVTDSTKLTTHFLTHQLPSQTKKKNSFERSPSYREETYRDVSTNFILTKPPQPRV